MQVTDWRPRRKQGPPATRRTPYPEPYAAPEQAPSGPPAAPEPLIDDLDEQTAAQRRAALGRQLEHFLQEGEDDLFAKQWLEEEADTPVPSPELIVPSPGPLADLVEAFGVACEPTATDENDKENVAA